MTFLSGSRSKTQFFYVLWNYSVLVAPESATHALLGLRQICTYPHSARKEKCRHFSCHFWVLKGRFSKKCRFLAISGFWAISGLSKSFLGTLYWHMKGLEPVRPSGVQVWVCVCCLNGKRHLSCHLKCYAACQASWFWHHSWILKITLSSTPKERVSQDWELLQLVSKDRSEEFVARVDF